MSVSKYLIKNTANAKAIRSDICELAFVNSCKIKNGYIIVDAYDEAEEKSVFSNIREIALNYGAVVSREDEAKTDEKAEKDEKLPDSTVNEQFSQEVSDENEPLKEAKAQTEEDKTVASELDKSNSDKEEKTLNERKKSFKKETISRVCELSLSLIFLIVGYFLPGTNSSFGIKTAVYIIAFAISCYDVIFEIIKAVMKKRIVSSSYVVAVLLISSVVFSGLSGGAVISLGYAFFLAVKQFFSTKIQLQAEEIFEKDKAEEVFNNVQKTFKDNRLTKIIYAVSLAIALGSFAFLIPALREYNDVIVVVSVSLILLSLGEEVLRFILGYKSIKLQIQGVEFKDFNVLKTLADANAFELDASVLTENGELKQDAIGAMKELISLNAKSLKTNFDIELKGEVRKQIDFKEKNFNGKKTAFVGDGKDISFTENGDVTLNNNDIKSLPWLYRALKRLKTTNRLFVAVVVSDLILAVLSYVFCGILQFEYISVICGALGYVILGLYLAFSCFDD